MHLHRHLLSLSKILWPHFQEHYHVPWNVLPTFSVLTSIMKTKSDVGCHNYLCILHYIPGVTIFNHNHHTDRRNIHHGQGWRWSAERIYRWYSWKRFAATCATVLVVTRDLSCTTVSAPENSSRGGFLDWVSGIGGWGRGWIDLWSFQSGFVNCVSPAFMFDHVRLALIIK